MYLEVTPQVTRYYHLFFSEGSLKFGIMRSCCKASPKDKASIVSYTIFWCKYEKDRPHYCEGFLDWEEVLMLDRSADTLIHNITLPDGGNYQMAIAANTETVSSGPFISASSSLENNFPFFFFLVQIFLELFISLHCFETSVPTS